MYVSNFVLSAMAPDTMVQAVAANCTERSAYELLTQDRTQISIPAGFLAGDGEAKGWQISKIGNSAYSQHIFPCLQRLKDSQFSVNIICIWQIASSVALSTS